MLLDKGENLLYLSHNIPEMDKLLQVFVEIWQCINAPDVMAKFLTVVKMWWSTLWSLTSAKESK